MSRSPVAQEFASELSPSLQSELSSRKEEIVAAVGPLPVRAAFRLCFGSILRLVPSLVEAAFSAILSKFGKMNIDDIAEKLVEHRQAVAGTDETTHRIPIHEL